MAAQKYAEVVGTPYSVYVAAVGTAFPAVDAVPGTGWTLLGVNGINNQGDVGVTVNLGETTSDFTPAGDTLPVKEWRTAEALSVQFSLVDTTVEAFSAILDNAVITTVAPTTGAGGYKSIKLKRGITVATYAVLVRGLSPYDDGSGTFNAQYEFTRCSQSGSQAPKYVKGTPAELAVEFKILGDVSGTDPALYLAQTAAHS
jgi:hypothetical protein